MQSVSFTEALDGIIDRDARYDREAYTFLRDALDFTLKKRRKAHKDEPVDVPASELLDGFRLYALKECGPMARLVLEYWGVRSCEDVGNLVFNLVQANVFSKTDRDTLEEFRAASTSTKPSPPPSVRRQNIERIALPRCRTRLMRSSLLLPSLLFATMPLLATSGYSETKTKLSSTPTGAAPLTLPPTTAQVFTLPNGLTVIVDEDHRAPVASVQAWCETGSIDEDKWMGAGLSHILEHMLFKGTTPGLPAASPGRSRTRGGYINAYTSFDRTVFYIDTPAEGAGEAVDILADAMMNATLPPDEYNKEQNVIRREFAMGFDDPDRVSSQLMFRTVFSQSPFRHPVIGYLDIYNRLTREDVFAYYKRRYVPNNMFFVIVGDVDAAKIKAQLEAAFEKSPRQALEPVYVAAEPPQGRPSRGPRGVPDRTHPPQPRLADPRVTDPDMPALDVLGTVLGGGASSPLNQEIREKKQLAYSVDAGSYALADGGIFAVQAVCAPEKREAVTAEALAILQRTKDNGVTPRSSTRPAIPPRLPARRPHHRPRPRR